MILFPNCKINLGLHVTEKRADGYHNLETAMVPVYGLCDAVEVIKNDREGIVFSSSGRLIDCPAEKNLCVKAYHILQERYGIGGVKIHLHKTVPFGAGLGGGSADAVFVLKALNECFALNLSTKELESMAGELGSDTVFFVRNAPALATGRGDVIEPIRLDLSGYAVMIVKPPLFVSTREAYRGVVPKQPEKSLKTVLAQDIQTWKAELKNDFERSVFTQYPEIQEIKDRLYHQGAVYASMSGSGSAVFGIFEKEAPVMLLPDDYFVYRGKML